MDDLQFYILFNSIYQDNGQLITKGLKRSLPQAELEPGTLDQLASP